MSQLTLAVNGAAGRMGQRIVALAAAADFVVLAALESPGHKRLGEDVGQIAGIGSLDLPLRSALGAKVDVVIDFSTPEGTRTILPVCVERHTPLVVATTGLASSDEAALAEAARRIPILFAPSMSLGVNLGVKLAESAAAALASHAGGVDVEIIERHHRFKEDAPSGTALLFGRAIAAIMGQTQAQHGRQGRPGARTSSEIGYHAVRAGDNPGEHTIVFGMLGETLEINVRATSRDAYAHGALAAARFLVSRPAGLYSMRDVLGL